VQSAATRARLQRTDERVRHGRVDGREGRHHDGVRRADLVEPGIGADEHPGPLGAHRPLPDPAHLHQVRPGQQVRTRHPEDLADDGDLEQRHAVQHRDGDAMRAHVPSLLSGS
jgi:hypothetical protein